MRQANHPYPQSRRTLPILIATAVIVAQPLPVAAQPAEQESPTVRSDGHFANLFRFEFKPGKSDEALTILRETLLPAWRAAGVEARLVEDMLGTKDVWLFVPLENGPEYYAYETPPQDIRAWAALNALFEGDAAAAERRLDEFVDLLVRQQQALVFVND
ncbi:MAG: hypothetical protein ABR601_07410 [Parasphingopyxis sp.]|nr:hypothetical protein [Sphingomonadales bacterium]